MHTDKERGKNSAKTRTFEQHTGCTWQSMLAICHSVHTCTPQQGWDNTDMLAQLCTRRTCDSKDPVLLQASAGGGRLVSSCRSSNAGHVRPPATPPIWAEWAGAKTQTFEQHTGFAWQSMLAICHSVHTCTRSAQAVSSPFRTTQPRSDCWTSAHTRLDYTQGTHVRSRRP